ncbi:MAG: phage antirepressor KilAC domain-containing protein, partial [Bacteroidales bacterium]
EKWNQPLQRYIEQGLFEMKINIVMRSTGQDQRTTTMVTGKGQIYFVNKFVKVPYL